MRTLYDSTVAADIPPLGPGDMQAQYASIPSSHSPLAVITIARNPTEDGNVGDCESSDLTPAQCPGWVTRQRQRGVWASIYCGAYNWAQVRSAFSSSGVPEPPYWVAQYDGVAVIPPDWLRQGCVAKQYINPPGSGGHYDKSIVVNYWRGVDPHMSTPTDYLGRGVIEALHAVATGSPAPQSDLDSVEAHANDPTNPGGWEFAIDTYVTSTLGGWGALHVTVPPPVTPPTPTPPNPTPPPSGQHTYITVKDGQVIGSFTAPQ